MSGKGFGKGFAAGLLLAILLIGISSGSYLTFGLYGSFTSAGAGDLPASVTTTMLTTAASATQNHSIPLGVYQSSTSTQTATVGKTIVASTTAATTMPGPSAGLNDLAAASRTPSSSLYNMVHQPITSDLLILIPILLAFFVGAIIYRASKTP
jgi:hypothetical protein